MRKIGMSAAALVALGFATSATAADLAPAPFTKAPPMVTVGWTGFYGGLNLGYGTGADSRDTGGQTWYQNMSGFFGNPTPGATEWNGSGGPAWNTSSNLNGVIGGGQIGYNWQVNPWLVLGLETDLQGSDLRGNASATNFTYMNLLPAPAGGANLWPIAGNLAASQQIDWYGTVRGRAGFTSYGNSLLTYVTGGLAYGNVKQAFTYTGGFLPDSYLGTPGTNWAGTASSSETKLGWTVGAGFEWRPQNWGRWSLKTEYLYTDLGSQTVNLTIPAYLNGNSTQVGRSVSASNRMDATFHTVRVGINYLFN